VSVRSDVLLWAQRIVAKKDAAPHVLLEINDDCGIDDAQAAFHRLARMAHPDLHRSSLEAAELDLVTTAYSRITAAYQEFRSQRMQTTRMQPIHDTGQLPTINKEAGRPISEAPLPPRSASGAAGAMNSKALIYYRKAELCLRRGDLRGAVLQLKMAIAGDPASTFLRTALTEVMAEVGKTP